MIDSLTTISGVCIALVVAIMGLAFPMFVERINGIVDKYGSPNISKKFKHETSYICFNVLIVLCIVEMFVFPIIMMAVSTQFCNLLLISIQGICVFTLCMVIIRVYFLVMTYSDPHSFFNRIKTNDTDDKKLLSSLQILIEYSSRNDMYADIYREAMEILRDKITDFQNERVNESQKNKQTQNNEYFEYPPHIYDVIKGLSKSSTKPDSVILNKQPDIVWSLYNIFTGFPITEKIYRLMWSWIIGMVEAKYDDWMKQYWSIATQYYSLKLDRSAKEEEKEKFREFHFMVGVLLFYQKRYDVLHHVFTFTNTYPPKYPFVPSKFSQIFEYCEKFPIDENPVYLTNNYNMFKTYPGANIEYMIEVLLLKYIALLMVRLFSVDDYNITFSDPMSLPDARQTIEENEYKINRITALIGHLKAIPHNAIKALDLKPRWKQDAKDLLERFIRKCKEKNQDLPKIHSVSYVKAEDIKQSLIETSKKSSPFLPSNECGSKEDGDEIFLADLGKKLPDGLILGNRRLVQRPDYVESVIFGLYTQLREFYYRKILQIDAIKTYSATYRDFGEALKQLKLTSEYAIVAIGVPANSMTTTKGFNIDDEDEIIYQSSCAGDCIKVHYIPYANDSIFLIMKERDVPRFRYRDLEESEYDKNEYREIESGKHLYSNIDNIKADNPVLKVKQGFYVHIPNKLEYVCIRIQSVLESDAVDVSNVEPIKNLIK